MGSTSDCPLCGGTGLIWGNAVDEYGLECENVRDCECRFEAKIARMLKKSGFDYGRYAEMSLENFKPDTDEAARMKRLAEAFLDDGDATGIGYFGKSGTGKTHVCIAVCQELARTRRVPHRYFAYRKEIAAIKALMYRNPDAYISEITNLCAVPVLYIDDLFKLAKIRGEPEDRDLQIMHAIVNDRCINKRTTLFSSECSLREITEIDEATGSRIYEMCNPHLVKCEGRNRRIKKTD